MSSERKSTAARVAELIDEIRRHDRLYFVEAAPVISDAEYDALVRELTALEREHPSCCGRLAHQRVGARRSRADGRRAPPPMLSLANTYDRAEVTSGSRAWAASWAGARQLVSLASPSSTGWRWRSSTRRPLGARDHARRPGGWGTTSRTRAHDPQPARRRARGGAWRRRGQPAAGLLEVRGEAIMTRATFERVNRDAARRAGRRGLHQLRATWPRARSSCSIRPWPPAVR
jgi:DNA ligase (NAD+)